MAFAGSICRQFLKDEESALRPSKIGVMRDGIFDKSETAPDRARI